MKFSRNCLFLRAQNVMPKRKVAEFAKLFLEQQLQKKTGYTQMEEKNCTEDVACLQFQAAAAVFATNSGSKRT